MRLHTPVKTLVVDDSASMLAVIRNLLGRIPDCEIIGEGNSGIQALTMARAFQPALIIMDIYMPMMGGLEALSKLKADMPSIQVVMMTSALDPEMREKVMAMGAEECLEKGQKLLGSLTKIVANLCDEHSGNPNEL